MVLWLNLSPDLVSSKGSCILLRISDSDSVHRASILTLCFKEVALAYLWARLCLFVFCTFPWILILNCIKVLENTVGEKKAYKSYLGVYECELGMIWLRQGLSSSNFELNKLFRNCKNVYFCMVAVDLWVALNLMVQEVVCNLNTEEFW